MTLLDISRQLYGGQQDQYHRAGSRTAVQNPTGAAVRYGTALEDSKDGLVHVVLDGSGDSVTLRTATPVLKDERVSVVIEGNVYQLYAPNSLMTSIEEARGAADGVSTRLATYMSQTSEQLALMATKEELNASSEAAVTVAADAIKSFVEAAGGKTAYTQTDSGFEWTVSAPMTSVSDATAREATKYFRLDAERGLIIGNSSDEDASELALDTDGVHVLVDGEDAGFFGATHVKLAAQGGPGSSIDMLGGKLLVEVDSNGFADLVGQFLRLVTGGGEEGFLLLANTVGESMSSVRLEGGDITLFSLGGGLKYEGIAKIPGFLFIVRNADVEANIGPGTMTAKRHMGMVIVTVDTLRLPQGPSADSYVVATLPEGWRPAERCKTVLMTTHPYPVMLLIKSVNDPDENERGKVYLFNAAAPAGSEISGTICFFAEA